MTRRQIRRRAAAERGVTELGWLHGRHTFSFGDYHDPKQMGFRSLRVINDDVIEPGGGFGTHPHRDMEIFTYVIEGELEHKDSMGNGRVLRAGDLQYMSAGSGVRHSEFNPSATNRTHLLQIWIRPRDPGGLPHYAEQSVAGTTGLTPLFAGRHRAAAKLYFARVARGETVMVPVEPGYGVWVQVITGAVRADGAELQPGDGAAMEGDAAVELAAMECAEMLVFVVK